MIAIPVRSISQYLLDSKPIPLQVRSRHGRVMNLEDAQGRFWAVAHPSIGNGPFHMVLAKPMAFSRLQANTVGFWDGHTLSLGNWQMRTDATQVWDPFLPRSLRSIPLASWETARGCAQAILATNPLTKDIDARTWTRLHQGMTLWHEAQRAADGVAMQQAAAQWIGLGPGLTPAGDDVLLGIMAQAWLRHADAPYSILPIQVLKRMWRGKGGTTRLSRAWLEHAASGRFAEPWHDLAAALSSAEEANLCRAVTRIAEIGATSGRLALLGAFSLP